MRLTVLKHPHDHLRRKALPMPLSDINKPETQKLIKDMFETMKAENGVGLAAAQVDMNVRLIVVDDGSGPQAYVNPVLTEKSWAKVASEEGCLSVPGVFGIVKRHRSVTYRAYDETGGQMEGKTTGLLAIILQHEIDHLDGMLFIDRVERFIKESESKI